MTDSDVRERFPAVGWGLRDMVFAGLTLLGLFGLLLLVLAAGVFVAQQAGWFQLSPSSLMALVFASEAFLILPAWLWGPGRYGGKWAALGVRRFPFLKSSLLVGAGLVLVLVINAAWDPVRRRLGLATQPDVLPLFGRGPGGLILALLLGAGVAPVAEEIFFRGYLYGGLRARWGVRWALLVSALIFALVHIIPGVLPPIFLMGILLAFIYESTASLWPAIALHGAINGLALVAAYLVERFPQWAPLAR